MTVNLLGREANSLPFVLKGNHFLREVFPFVERSNSAAVNCFYALAKFCLTHEVSFLLRLEVFEVSLVALVDSSRCILEACPDLLAEVAFYGTRFAEVLMKLLELVEGADNILKFDELFSSFAKCSLDFKVLLEVVRTHLVVEAEEVVVLLNVELVVLPKFRSAFCGHGLHVLPVRLEVLKFLIVLVGILGRSYEFLDALDDGELLFKVVLLFRFEGFSSALACLLDDVELHLQFSFAVVGSGHEVLGESSILDIFLAGSSSFRVVNLVINLLEQVNFCALSIAGVKGDFLEASDNFLLCSGLYLLCFLFCGNNCYFFNCCRCNFNFCHGGNILYFYFRIQDFFHNC